MIAVVVAVVVVVAGAVVAAAAVVAFAGRGNRGTSHSSSFSSSAPAGRIKCPLGVTQVFGGIFDIILHMPSFLLLSTYTNYKHTPHSRQIR